jgi:tRNA-modifying protein YgfZ
MDIITERVAPQGRARLDDWGVLEAAGVDAAAFLQGQLTNDVAALSTHQWCLAGYCSAKGRLLATFVVWRPAPERFLLALPRELLGPTLKRLSMFVLRAKCKLSDATSTLAIEGVWSLASMDQQAPGTVTRQGDATVLGLPSLGGLARAWHVVPAVTQAAAVQAPTSTVDAATWRWLDVLGGWPVVRAATVDAFVPQMVNLEVLGGVNFRKGCYPGQEVVARSQYRGTLKRRMHLFAGAVDARAGQDVFHASDTTQPVGTVVDAADAPASPTEPHERWVLASIKTTVLEAGGALAELHIGSPEGAVMVQRPLPYAVPALAQDPA